MTPGPGFSGGPLGVGRHTTPDHRRAQGLSSDQSISGPLAIRSGRLTLELGPGLELLPDGTLGLKVTGSALSLTPAGLTATFIARDVIGEGLEADNYRNTIILLKLTALTTLAADGETANATYVDTELQATMDKIDTLIGLLKTALHMEA